MTLCRHVVERRSSVAGARRLLVPRSLLSGPHDDDKQLQWTTKKLHLQPQSKQIKLQQSNRPSVSPVPVHVAPSQTRLQRTSSLVRPEHGLGTVPRQKPSGLRSPWRHLNLATWVPLSAFSSRLLRSTNPQLPHHLLHHRHHPWHPQSGKLPGRSMPQSSTLPLHQRIMTHKSALLRLRPKQHLRHPHSQLHHTVPRCPCLQLHMARARPVQLAEPCWQAAVECAELQCHSGRTRLPRRLQYPQPWPPMRLQTCLRRVVLQLHSPRLALLHRPRWHPTLWLRSARFCLLPSPSCQHPPQGKNQSRYVFCQEVCVDVRRCAMRRRSRRWLLQRLHGRERPSGKHSAHGSGRSWNGSARSATRCACVFCVCVIVWCDDDWLGV